MTTIFASMHTYACAYTFLCTCETMNVHVKYIINILYLQKIEYLEYKHTYFSWVYLEECAYYLQTHTCIYKYICVCIIMKTDNANYICVSI